MRDAQCHNCKRKGHYSAQCHQRAVSSIQDGETSESAFVDTVSSGRKSVWIVHIAINGTEISFKLDTGAEVTTVSKQVWELLRKPALQSPHQQFFGAAKNPLEVLGQIRCHCACHGEYGPTLNWSSRTNYGCHKRSPPAITGPGRTIRGNK